MMRAAGSVASPAPRPIAATTVVWKRARVQLGEGVMLQPQVKSPQLRWTQVAPLMA